tara:strand:- start:156 stop:476 length:321 start_codon:yes stop_codon:yes gene_type:complete
MSKTEPRIFHVFFPHGNYEINENSGEQTVPMLDMGLLKINSEAEPSFNLWANIVVKTSSMPKIYFDNKDAGIVKNFREFEKTTLRAKRQPEVIAFIPKTLEEWEES